MNKRLSLATLISFSLVLLFAGMLAVPFNAGATGVQGPIGGSVPACTKPYNATIKLGINAINWTTLRFKMKVFIRGRLSNGELLAEEQFMDTTTVGFGFSGASRSYTLSRDLCIGAVQYKVQLYDYYLRQDYTGKVSGINGEWHTVPDPKKDTYVTCNFGIMIQSLGNMYGGSNCTYETLPNL